MYSLLTGVFIRGMIILTEKKIFCYFLFKYSSSQFQMECKSICCILTQMKNVGLHESSNSNGITSVDNESFWSREGKKLKDLFKIAEPGSLAVLPHSSQ